MIGGCRRSGRLAGEVEGRGVRFVRTASRAWLEVYVNFLRVREFSRGSSGFSIPRVVLLPGALLGWKCGEGLGDGRMISRYIHVIVALIGHLVQWAFP